MSGRPLYEPAGRTHLEIGLHGRRLLNGCSARRYRKKLKAESRNFPKRTAPRLIRRRDTLAYSGLVRPRKSRSLVCLCLLRPGHSGAATAISIVSPSLSPRWPACCDISASPPVCFFSSSRLSVRRFLPEPGCLAWLIDLLSSSLSLPDHPNQPSLNYHGLHHRNGIRLPHWDCQCKSFSETGEKTLKY